jgi:hypothetical protein
MTPAEIIATKLLGWERLPVDPPIYTKGLSEVAVEDGEEYRRDWDPSHTWPDLSDYNCIRRMEDALAEKGLMEGSPSEPSYTRMLRRIVGPDQSDCCVGLRATPEQRVAAALKVIEEAGL